MLESLRAVPPQAVQNLPGDSRTLLAAVRHMIIAWPRSPAAHAMLIDRYGAGAGGIEHLLRCLLVGIGRTTRRRPAFGSPCCALLLPDEAELLDAIGLDGAEPDPSALVRLAGNPAAERFAAVARLIGETVACEARHAVRHLATDAPY
jgi:hypothetical protein